MSESASHPTPNAEVNALLRELQIEIQNVLGDELLGLYLDGSLALGDFDASSDIDFVAVTKTEIQADSPRFAALYALHQRIAALDSPFATELEGSYISARALRRYDPDLVWHPNIERGSDERLKMADHDEAWNIHRFVLRTRGIVLTGPPPISLIDPIDAAALKRGMGTALSWLDGFQHKPGSIASSAYQTYLVLTVCRVWYTLMHGAVVSKPAAAHWAQAHLGQPWSALIARAWHGRSGPHGAVNPDELRLTLALIAHLLANTG